MQVSVAQKEGLQREVQVTLPKADYDQAVAKKLSNISRTAKIAGFRPGKVPMNIIKQRYQAQAEQEVSSDLIQNSLFKAIEEQKLDIAAMPSVNKVDFDDAGDFQYSATVEVMPQIELVDFKKLEVKYSNGKVEDKDIEKMIENLQQQHSKFETVKRKAKNKDQVKINFLGKIDGVEFTGGKGENVEVVLGDKKMIPGFEEQIVGMQAGDKQVINVDFPEDYGQSDLQGKAATFDIEVIEVAKRILPQLDEEFYKLCKVKDAADLREKLNLHMSRELAQKLNADNKQALLEVLLKEHQFDVPQGLIKQEIKSLKRQVFSRQMGASAKELDELNLDSLSDEPFVEEATNRVKTGLILGAIIEGNNIEADEDSVKATIANLAESYERPDEVIKYYYQNPQLLQQMKSLATEEKAVEMVLEQVKRIDSEKTFSEIMN